MRRSESKRIRRSICDPYCLMPVQVPLPMSQRESLSSEGPSQLPVTEVSRDPNREHTPLPAGKEMRGLALIRPPGLDPVIGSRRNLQLLLQIAVVVAEQETETAIGVREPPFKGARDTLPEVVGGLEGQLLRPKQRP